MTGSGTYIKRHISLSAVMFFKMPVDIPTAGCRRHLSCAKIGQMDWKCDGTKMDNTWIMLYHLSDLAQERMYGKRR